jgi:hypothetical protein
MFVVDSENMGRDKQLTNTFWKWNYIPLEP